jgi:hypothetical protein
MNRGDGQSRFLAYGSGRQGFQRSPIPEYATLPQ